MDKAMHSEFEGHKSEWDEILRGNDAKRFMEIMKSSKPLSEAEIKRIRENYERMAKIESPDLLKENQSLRSELQRQKGELKAAKVCIQLRDIQLEQQKELNAELVEGLVTVKSYLDSFKDQWKEGEEYLSFTVESLIKKSKES